MSHSWTTSEPFRKLVSLASRIPQKLKILNTETKFISILITPPLDLLFLVIHPQPQPQLSISDPCSCTLNLSSEFNLSYVLHSWPNLTISRDELCRSSSILNNIFCPVWPITCRVHICIYTLESSLIYYLLQFYSPIPLPTHQKQSKIFFSYFSVFFLTFVVIPLFFIWLSTMWRFNHLILSWDLIPPRVRHLTNS